MDRLTQRDEYGNADIIALSDVMPEVYAGLSFGEANALTAALNRLADYEDAEEAGRLVILPFWQKWRKHERRIEAMSILWRDC